MKKKEFKEKIDNIIYAETPEIQQKLINLLYKDIKNLTNDVKISESHYWRCSKIKI